MASYNISSVAADGLNIFYREAGPTDAPVILLLHGFPSSSHQFRNLIPLLAAAYHVIAPDLPGFGFTEVPNSRAYPYTFDSIATSIEAFLDALSIKKFSPYIFDYGAPTGLRLALRRPEAVQAIFSQNGNAYDEGLGAFWDPLKEFWKGDGLNISLREAITASTLTLDATKGQYLTGTVNPNSTIAPETYTLDQALLDRPGQTDIQLGLFYDYRKNVEMYPQFQEYFRKSQVPLIAFWGKNDPIFIPAGAEAFKKDLPNAEIHLLDAGHFAVESNTKEIANLMLRFLKKNGI
ncbi:putative hydrolase [Lachnellula hyalina]|uniref:Putative hydrolase n=1 Tax=Lachnellula hyalina TaxID=1316788 RepID=A0A8H8U204_9HELO|nr:putative hydrolase [Lachnellula hyalina]TVY30957.1 putative hydrolase [Lachnellula hyalina]